MPPPIIRTPTLQKILHPTDQTVNRIQDHLLEKLNPVLRNGTNAIQGAPVQQQQSTDDGKAIVYSSSTKSWILSAFSSFATLATNLIYGVVRLSVAAADPTDPIAVGDNDPRNSNARTPTGPAGGGLSGTYPNPTVTGAPPTGTAGGALAGTYPNPSLANVGTAGTYGDSTHVPQITTNAGGQVSAVTSVAINFPSSNPTATTVDLWDDFEGYQISLRWNPETVGTGTVGPTRISTIVSGNNGDNACGNIDCFVPAAGDTAGIDWGGAPGYLNSASNPFVGYIEWAAMFLAGATPPLGTYRYRLGFGESITSLLAGTGQSITLGQDDTGGFAAYINLGAGENKFPTVNLIPFGSPLIVYRIVFPPIINPSAPLPYPKFYINGTDTGIDISSLGTFPQGATVFLQPLAEITAVTIPGITAPHMYLDYFTISRMRPTMTG